MSLEKSKKDADDRVQARAAELEKDLEERTQQVRLDANSLSTSVGLSIL